MSLEVLRQVSKANKAAKDDERRRDEAMGHISPETPSSPLPGPWGGALDTTVPPPRRRR